MTHGERSTDDSGTHIARVYNALLGGKDNYESDRAIADEFTAVAPEFTALAWDNRQFLMRASRFLAGEAGISQFLDFGACLPVGDSTHEVVQRLNRNASVVYIGMDPLVLAHGRALLADNDMTHIVDVNWLAPQNVLNDAAVCKYIDFEQPVAFCHVGTLMHVPDEYDPWDIMRELIDASAPGSYFAFAHLLDPGPGHELAELAARVQDVYLNSPMASGWFRPIDRITEMLPGLDLVEPGVVPLADWWPDGPRLKPVAPVQRLLVGAVGRKP
ncbi:S-adenosyl methyltransferase [Actinocrispum wychmicini]|uniref:S-adenosyl methyltransferase n=2 Tax=Actinocrispum wychmicini TaxID=1213861 RepID=A0A4R2JPB8_9PSEU|nr:S-adenosyl methyltransferase [Actinocrispum wychmicini]